MHQFVEEVWGSSWNPHQNNKGEFSQQKGGEKDQKGAGRFRNRLQNNSREENP